MIEISILRKTLGKEAENRTDEEIEQIRNTLVVLADLAIDSYLGKRKVSLEKTNAGVDILKQKGHY